MADWAVVAGFQLRALLRRRLVWLLATAPAVPVGFLTLVLRMTTAEGFTSAILFQQLLNGMLGSSCLLISAAASFAAIVTVGADNESGRVQMVVSRPVRREGVFLGQFLGLGAGVAAYAALFYVAILLTFMSNTGLRPSGWWVGIPVFTLAPLVQLALTLWLSARMGPVASGVSALLLLLLTWLGRALEATGHTMRLEQLELTGVMISLALPAASLNDWLTGHLRHGMGESGLIRLQLGSDPSGWMLLYGLLYLAGVLAAGMAAYRRREF